MPSFGQGDSRRIIGKGNVSLSCRRGLFYFQMIPGPSQNKSPRSRGGFCFGLRGAPPLWFLLLPPPKPCALKITLHNCRWAFAHRFRAPCIRMKAGGLHPTDGASFAYELCRYFIAHSRTQQGAFRSTVSISRSAQNCSATFWKSAQNFKIVFQTALKLPGDPVKLLLVVDG